ncbi:hypothetical protein PTSG_10679 [Salpingoeca rosetta]|uniref:XPG-I domain-containing protein n=1 Tax=Salpingoeca rosetta (strain ATCC 50818 / BSB-021) TaxID=946362 RepID=F2UQ26_SALR5|nr:uncharacterized protein PTSG_10679 [Salpingoeca rosetta]EGD79694.1 hypothetical protein PTSG_10679 [Salpingoeca rosetta]|eukprot:XP_004988644.1 hypothetical protein PTSG_10679 [Salpingoeca rosetta]
MTQRHLAHTMFTKPGVEKQDLPVNIELYGLLLKYMNAARTDASLQRHFQEHVQAGKKIDPELLLEIVSLAATHIKPEADAQLAYLLTQGEIKYALLPSGDSDLAVYGQPEVVFNYELLGDTRSRALGTVPSSTKMTTRHMPAC